MIMIELLSVNNNNDLGLKSSIKAFMDYMVGLSVIVSFIQ